MRYRRDPSSHRRMSAIGPINARAESVAEKPAFRNAFRHRRCLIAADGYFEWRKLERTKQPYFIALKDCEPFAFAGVWDHWARDEHSIDSCAIIVTEANELTKPIHDRMPVILAPQVYDAWMDPDLTDPGRLKAFLKPYPSERMLAYPVSKARYRNRGFFLLKVGRFGHGRRGSGRCERSFQNDALRVIRTRSRMDAE